MDYSNFSNISIYDYKYIYSHKSSHFYKFCISNNLNTLKEIFEFFDGSVFHIKNKNTRAEIYGIVDILRYVYLNQHIDFWDKLDKRCATLKGVDADTIKFEFFYSKYHDFIRGFGFTRGETFDICEYLDYGGTIGDAIIALYEHMKVKSWAYSAPDFPITFKKIELFANYYMKLKGNDVDLQTLGEGLRLQISEGRLLDKKIEVNELEIKTIQNDGAITLLKKHRKGGTNN